MINQMSEMIKNDMRILMSSSCKHINKVLQTLS